jgi:Mce-associated membrane protein
VTLDPKIDVDESTSTDKSAAEEAGSEESTATELTADESTATELTAEDSTAEDDQERDTDDAGESARPQKRRRLAGVRAKWLVPVLLTVLLLASAGVAAWLYVYQYRVDQQTDAAASAAQQAAKDGAKALLSYSPESIDKDLATAKTHLTGDFLEYYTTFTEQIVAPAAKQKSVKTAASVVRSAVSEIHPDSAVVLIFVNQATTSKENPDGAFAGSSVKVGLTKVDGKWLISSFDPV